MPRIASDLAAKYSANAASRSPIQASDPRLEIVTLGPDPGVAFGGNLLGARHTLAAHARPTGPTHDDLTTAEWWARAAQRPGWRSSTDLLHVETGTKIDLGAMPATPIRLMRWDWSPCPAVVIVVNVITVSVDIAVVRSVTSELVQAFGRLLPQLSRSAQALDSEALRRLVDWPGNQLLVARVDGEIMGTLTLVTFPIPTGLRAWIEDVVVDETARGRGVGAALLEEAIRLARATGARTVDLTSRPSRTAANRLYERLGFQVRDSHVYRHAKVPAP